MADWSRRNSVLKKGRVDEFEGRRDVNGGSAVEWSAVVGQIGSIVRVI